MVSPRSALLISADDPIPDGAFFVEARFRAPEGEWVPAVPGAARASLDNGVLASTPAEDRGRFPLPDREITRAALDAWGVSPATPIVVYAVEPDDAKTAARAWFVLREAGVADVRVLDGGVHALRARRAGGPADARTVVPASVRPVVAVDADRAADVAESGVLLDARPVDAFRAGRIPGAISAPGAEVFRDGRLRPESELRAWSEELISSPTAPVAAYCGGGVAAAGTVFALATLGIDAELYVGSWSEWSRSSHRPIEIDAR